MRSFLIILGFCLLVVGCSSKSTMKKYSQDTYEISVVDDNSFDSLNDMQTRALNEAHDYCAKEGKKYDFLSQRVQQARTAAESVEVALFFRCK
jgi:hypothetical protein